MMLAFLIASAATIPPGTECGPRAVFLEIMSVRLGERSVGRGLTAEGVRIELFVSADGKTWTILASGPSDEACVLTHGRAWGGER